MEITDKDFEKAQKILEQKAKKDGISLENIEKKLFVFNILKKLNEKREFFKLENF
jgi:hypothetical protein